RAVHQPWWMLLGGLMGLLIVFTVTYAGPRIGVAARVGILIAGQLAMGAAMDRWGLFGSERIALHWPRLLGIALLAAAEPYYDARLPAHGLTERYHGEKWKVWATTEPLPGTAYFAVTESEEHAANENRIAFWVASRQDVERVAGVAHEAGALDLSGPKEMPYGPG